MPLVGLGADARVGFTQDIFTPQVYWFSRYFWDYTMRDGDTIEAALQQAGDSVIPPWGGGLGSIEGKGSLGQKLRPAVYGE